MRLARVARERTQGRRTNVHDGDAGCVELVDSPLGRYSDCADEELGLLFDDDVDELRQLALCVVVLLKGEWFDDFLYRTE